MTTITPKRAKSELTDAQRELARKLAQEHRRDCPELVTAFAQTIVKLAVRR